MVIVKISEMCSIGSSSAAKGFKKDMRQSQLTKKRETKRNIRREADDFALVLAGIYPAYFGESK